MNKQLEHEKFILSFENTRYQQSSAFFKLKECKKFLIQIKDCDGKIKLSGNVFLRTNSKGKNSLYCPRGPMFNVSDIEYFQNFLIEARRIAKKYDATKIICNPLIQKKYVNYFQELGCVVIDNPGTTKLPPNEILIRAESEEKFLNQMSKSCRKNIRKAISYGLISEEVNDIKKFDFDEFYNLYKDTAERKAFKPRTKTDLWNYINNLDANCLRFNETRYNNKIVSMSIDYCYNHVLECLYSVSNNNYNNKKPNNMLHWGRMLYCINCNNINYFLCGGVYCNGDDTSHPDYGVYAFKSSLCEGNITSYIGDIIYKF